MSERITKLDDATTFYSGPAEFLAQKVAEAIANVPQFAAIFGSNIDAYKRMDYSMREMPALRIYNDDYNKEFESWFINGDLIIDVIFPASLRRPLMQKYQDTVTSALCQQFRRTAFFEALCVEVPGLNELGKAFSADKSLGFSWGKESQEPVPLTQIRANFRLDLRQWDEFLVSDDRTKEDPFEKTLGNLELIHSEIAGLENNGTVNVVVQSDLSLV